MSRAKVVVKLPTIEQLLVATVPQVFDMIEETLDNLNIPYTYNKDFIVTNIKSLNPLPLVCVHVDTVGRVSPKLADLVVNKGVISLSPKSAARCLGADDRAGVWIALQLIASKTKTKFNFGFFDHEESGAQGSTAFADKYPAAQYSCLIGLDRSDKPGPNVATYGYDNDELTKIFTDLRYDHSFGSFSDCSNLAEFFNVPCLNLSVGYKNEHTVKETLDIKSMEKTLKTMQSVVIPEQEYEMLEQIRYKWDSDFSYTVEEPVVCDYCSQHKPLYTTADAYMMCRECLDYYKI